jgi:hypothetical protein
LNRSLDISFYQRGRAVWGERREEYARKGYPDYAFRSDQDVRKEALREILSNPAAHLRTTLVAGWRSMFIERGKPDPTLVYMSSLALVPIVAVATVNWPLLLIWLPPGFLFSFTALLTHGLPRYNQPILPMVAVFSVILAWMLIRKVWSLLAKLEGGPGMDKADRKIVSDV